MSLLRVTQEALANIAKHAGASRVIVSLSYLGDTVTLDIDDDGVGFAGRAGPRANGGFGLIGMRKRIASVGGELSVESAPGQGTTIAVSVPYDRGQDHAPDRRRPPSRPGRAAWDGGGTARSCRGG